MKNCFAIAMVWALAGCTERTEALPEGALAASADGEVGLPGEPGPMGPRGQQGLIGEQGPVGDQGPIGEQGAVGERGPVGARGFSGNQGPIGVPGLTGLTGSQGGTGLTGTVGDTGPRGEVGDIGPQGDTGEVGPQGGLGEQGESGADGATTDWGGIYHNEVTVEFDYTDWDVATALAWCDNPTDVPMDHGCIVDSTLGDSPTAPKLSIRRSEVLRDGPTGIAYSVCKGQCADCSSFSYGVVITATVQCLPVAP